jgi:CcdC protein
METSSLVVVALIPLIAWRLYARVKRLMSRQKSRLWRHWAASILFPLLLLMLGFAAMRNPLSLASLAGGVAVGVALAVWGLKLTRFERTDEGYFFTPNARIGLALSALLVMRIAYRFASVGISGMRDQGAALAFTRSPLTQVVVGLVMGYYAAYAMGLLRWRLGPRADA